MSNPTVCFARKGLLCALIICITVLPAAMARASDTARTPRQRISAVAGGMQVNIEGVTGSGTVLPGGSGNLQAPDSIDTTGWQIAYAFDTGAKLPTWLDSRNRSSDLTITAEWARYDGNTTSGNNVAAGSADTGLLFTRPPAPTGYFPGAAGLQSRATTDVDYGYLEAGVQWLHALNGLPPRMRLTPRLALGWTQYDYQVTTFDSFDPAVVAPADYRDERDQYMQQDIFQLNVGARLEQAFGGRGQYSAFASAEFVTYFLKATLSSFEYVTLAGNTRLRWVGEGERGMFAGADFGLGFAWQVTPAWRVDLTANYSPWLPTATIVNPTAVGDPAPRTYVASDREAIATLLAGASYQF